MPRQKRAPEEVLEDRRRAGRLGAAARHSVDTYVKQIVARAPELTPEQRATIRAALASSAPTQQVGGATT